MLTLFVWTSWIPLTALVAVDLYVDRFEGWGQWAAAPLLLAPVILSGVFVLVGVGLTLRDRLRCRVLPSTWLGLAFSSAPCVWLVWRLIVTM